MFGSEVGATHSCLRYEIEASKCGTLELCIRMHNSAAGWAIRIVMDRSGEGKVAHMRQVIRQSQLENFGSTNPSVRNIM